MRAISMLGLAGLTILLLNGCATGSGGGTAGDGTDASGSTAATGTSGASGTDSTTSGAADGMGFSGHPLDDPQSPLANRSIYFDFDSYQVSAEGEAILTAHAEYLVANPAAQVALEGHCDERGTREYNMALGERRAQALADILMALGASQSQIRANSQGEEQPVALCHDDSCWSLNRRGEVVYTAR